MREVVNSTYWLPSRSAAVSSVAIGDKMSAPIACAAWAILSPSVDPVNRETLRPASQGESPPVEFVGNTVSLHKH